MILVIGATQCRTADLLRTANKYYGLTEKDFEFVNDYNKIKDYDFGSLYNSTKYSDIIVGQVPHKCGKSGDFANVFHKMNSVPGFPKVIKAGNGSMRITVSSFKRDLGNTKLVKVIKSKQI